MYDIIIIGSGPAGIYSSYLGKIHNLKTKILESSYEIGGQMNLYKDKPVYDMPGFVNANGKDILSSILKQHKTIEDEISFNENVIEIKGEFPEFTVITNSSIYKSKCIILSTGGGTFTPVKLGLENELKFSNIRYRVDNVNDFYDKKLIIFGGGDSAVDWAHFFHDKVKELILVHRREKFRAQEMLLSELKKKIKILTPYKINKIYGDDKVNEVSLINIKNNENILLKIDEILVFFGQNKRINKDNLFNIDMKENYYIVKSDMETSRNGIYAIGNASIYKGKINMLSVCFGESATAVGSVVAKIFPGKKMTYVKQLKENI